jgi:hypothetical protein
MNRLLLCACLLLTAFFFFASCASDDDQITGRRDPAAEDAVPVPGAATPAPNVRSGLSF